ncbi:GMC oxidoreductase [Aeromicrobium choanae]|uniref:Cholesterol oxidase n=1 Tax=Aeromicrobium choanae TaxID=1736691 RepID=A0A1T4Z885_9ACTN|nr:GMC oxidoreductase [Aeromicrobium choanae]SKB10156.1 cholesterol oxidase [Aeromicrobium choanae]
MTPTSPTSLTRRDVLAAGAVLGAAATIGGTTKPAAAARVPVAREEHPVVIVGSGFGGGVAALRFAQAGVPVLVLERGRRWPTGPNATTFPTLSSLDERALWYGSANQVLGKPLFVAPYVGLLEAVTGRNMTAMCAAGVGGGSLVYQGMTLQPNEELFNHCLPEELDYARMAAVHYPRVARMLRLQTAPDELVRSPTYKPARIFAEHVQREGYDLEKIPMPIDWSWALRELKGEMRPSYTNGDSALGVNNGGKHSIDVTYIKQAEDTGRAKVLTQHNVIDIERAKDGRWVVHVDRTDDRGTILQRKILTTKTLVMAAGSINTTKLLVRSVGRGHLPRIDGLGTNWGTNGDRIYLWTSLAEDFGAVQGGPVVYGSKDWSTPETANTIIQASIPGLGINARSTMMVGFGISDARGRFAYDWLTDEAKLTWPRNGDARLFEAIQARAKRIAAPMGSLADTNAVVPSTWHPLGGVAMGTSADLAGRVHDLPGLYVLDGALIPGSTAACNPSMTIAAVAERAMDEIVAHDLARIV